MSTTRETIDTQIQGLASAANADDLGDRVPDAKVTDTASGWDAYEVWRRFIKEARDRREAGQIPPRK
ncbi:MAG TPA: hypothetical protein PKE27_12790 [Povalibacter sp.]|uniref:hypothetical protein n=1 Tax=Povalibacter sp. TaxID=1962978 RepID=UPI002BD68E4D|nr:hypothetical protein [Povalibacter sp.]HMN45452.1 hypothetical protein [Povalibacter sp.]